jgi:LytS/YehU family sensor histidine kinase
MYFTVLGCVHAFTYFVEARERETQAARLAAQLAESRLGALRMQLHPHFLFNSLNAVAVLVRDQRTREATSTLELLSDVLREVLRTDPAHEVALAEELHFLEQYLAIEQVRFSDRLRVTFAADPVARVAAVPRFVLQPLVENALRHGLAERSGEGSIEIVARREGADLVLAVRDNGVGLRGGVPEADEAGAVPARGSGVGLANTRERLATLYGDRARLELAPAPGGGTVATVRLPYRVWARR